MKFRDNPITESEANALTKVLVEGLRAIDGLHLKLPLFSGAKIADTMYQVEIMHHRDVQSPHNVVFTIRTRLWILKVPGAMNMRTAKADLHFDAAELILGSREEMQHDLTLAALFIE